MRTIALLLTFFATAVSAQSVEELIASAENNNVHAQLQLAERFLRGRDVEQSDQDAIYWYQKAAEGGSHVAAAKLGFAYYRGIGTKSSDEKASFWLSQAAFAGDPQSTYLLGRLYEGRKEPLNNLILAEVWYQKAATINPKAENDFARVAEKRFNQLRAKQLSKMESMDLAEQTPSVNQHSKSDNPQAISNPTYALSSALLGVLVLVCLLWKKNRSLRAHSKSLEEQIQQQKLKWTKELSSKTERLKKQKSQIETLYKHVKNTSTTSSTNHEALNLSCALFGFNPAKIPEQKQIKVRYKQLCKVYHPDLQGSDDEMKRLNQALKIILAFKTK
ncbi:J domain-containing protein [Vibrio caribbeanicus]|uniref:J domain-containing protein n=1 Tax=Vibrio caribbeanicus TaxID=701175 RepID=UPI002284397C|nr:J domain-containing protein [Vibrio caribbeanicus]MCY9846016.1 J domain-containing protein [Vibrio caribbeanicus]